MGDRTPIEWTDASWNPIRARNRATGAVGWHCEHASEGCRNCYAEAFNEKRLGTRLPFKPGHRADIEIFLDEAKLLEPLRWRRPRRIFVGSMTDLFADFVPDAMIDRILAVVALCPQHTFQVLTKRPARIRAYMTRLDAVEDNDWLRDDRRPGTDRRIRWCLEALLSDGPAMLFQPQLQKTWPLPNVWLGTSCEDQATADARVPELLATPAAVRFVSAEPLLGPIDFTTIGYARGYASDALRGYHHDFGVPIADLPGKLDQIIVGGESGPGARPMHPDWARAIREQCATAGVPFFFKQWGVWGPGVPFTADLSARQTYRGEIQTLQLAQRRAFKLAIPTRDDDALGPALTLERFGKALAGRILDGRTHDAMPVTSHG